MKLNKSQAMDIMELSMWMTTTILNEGDQFKIVDPDGSTEVKQYSTAETSLSIIVYLHKLLNSGLPMPVILKAITTQFNANNEVEVTGSEELMKIDF